MSTRPRLYGNRSPAILDGRGGHYTRNFWAIQREGLPLTIASVAAELAYRDMLIDDLTAKLKVFGNDYPQSQRAKVVSALQSSGKPMSNKDIQQATGLNKSQVTSSIKALRHRYGDRIVRVLRVQRSVLYTPGTQLTIQIGETPMLDKQQTPPKEVDVKTLVPHPQYPATLTTGKPVVPPVPAKKGS